MFQTKIFFKVLRVSSYPALFNQISTMNILWKSGTFNKVIFYRSISLTYVGTGVQERREELFN